MAPQANEDISQQVMVLDASQKDDALLQVENRQLDIGRLMIAGCPFPAGSPLQPMVSDDICFFSSFFSKSGTWRVWDLQWTAHLGKWVTCIGKPEGLQKTGCTVYGQEYDGTCHTFIDDY